MITRYEITAHHPDGRTYLVGYTPRKSRRGLLSAMQNVGGPMIEKLDIGEDDEISFATKPAPRALTGEWIIAFTGRTQLDARSEGEHEFIAQ